MSVLNLANCCNIHYLSQSIKTQFKMLLYPRDLRCIKSLCLKDLLIVKKVYFKGKIRSTFMGIIKDNIYNQPRSRTFDVLQACCNPWLILDNACVNFDINAQKGKQLDIMGKTFSKMNSPFYNNKFILIHIKCIIYK